MPHLKIPALIDRLRSHAAELHSCYVDCKDFDLSDRLLDQVFQLENLIRTLEVLERDS